MPVESYSLSFAIFLLMLVFERGLEIAIARQHAQWARQQGGREFGKSLTRWIILFHVAWFGSFFFEAWVGRPKPPVPQWVPFIALGLLQAGRYWCILSLGKFWNTRIIVIPGASPVSPGPYRFLRHPNYWIVRLEIFIYPLLFGCWRTSLVGGLLNLWLVHRRIRQEEQALHWASEQNH
ncbi:MAG: hypothetical protein D6814_12385 [Calditrichaeota bacterium]|nr:MAG: hypothetical protein D6814_12385 [Calditrichota bacterium]